MKFIKEVGIILDPNRNPLTLVEGTPGMVNFPQQLAWELHKKQPGVVWAFCHTHPPFFSELSHEDETTLRAWAYTLYPFPARMTVITKAKIGRQTDSNWVYGISPAQSFTETTYLGVLEPKEIWQKCGGRKLRKFEIIKEETSIFNFTEAEYNYQKIIIERSYG